MQLNNFPQYADQAAEQVPGVRRHDPRPARAAPRHDHGGLRGRRADLCRDRRRRGAAARRDRRRGGRAARRTASPSRTPWARASWRAREWLGLNATLDEGAPADFVVYDADPRADLTVLARPARVVLAWPGGGLTAESPRRAAVVPIPVQLERCRRVTHGQHGAAGSPVLDGVGRHAAEGQGLDADVAPGPAQRVGVLRPGLPGGFGAAFAASAAARLSAVEPVARVGRVLRAAGGGGDGTARRARMQ